MQAGTTEPALPRDSATVVLLRDGPAGIEAFLLRRVTSMAFAAGAHVFPGGSVDPRDAEIDWVNVEGAHAQRAVDRTAAGTARWAGASPQEWAGILSAGPPLARALVCAAVRETFEESGVLLAGPSATEVVADTTDEHWEADRLALLDRSLSLAGLLARRRLVLRADLLRPWAHWITPEVEPRRFDTRFFVAALPAGQQPRQVGGEADRVAWLRPADALDRQRASQLTLLPPTAVTLGELSAYATVADVLAASTRRDIRPVLPKVMLAGDEPAVLLPGDQGYE